MRITITSYHQDGKSNRSMLETRPPKINGLFCMNFLFFQSKCPVIEVFDLRIEYLKIGLVCQKISAEKVSILFAILSVTCVLSAKY